MEGLTFTEGSAPSKAWPVAQVSRHSPVVQSCPPPQATPHEPQFALSRFTSTQAALQLVMQAVPQVPLEQIGRSNEPVAGHAVHEAPQALA